MISAQPNHVLRKEIIILRLVNIILCEISFEKVFHPVPVVAHMPVCVLSDWKSKETLFT